MRHMSSKEMTTGRAASDFIMWSARIVSEAQIPGRHRSSHTFDVAVQQPTAVDMPQPPQHLRGILSHQRWREAVQVVDEAGARFIFINFP